MLRVFCDKNNINMELASNRRDFKKMKVEIWSDIMCPFCYIGKRQFEVALSQFEHKNNIEVEWHSFQLDSTISNNTNGLTVYEYLAQRKGISYEKSVEMHKQVVMMAKEAGLNYDFEKAIVANSFDAHRLIQIAKNYNLGDELEERLFKAYFIEGINVGDISALIDLGEEIGLEQEILTDNLKNDHFSNEVYADIEEAKEIGVTGVPFFVFNRTYAVSGAQPSSVFLETLLKSHENWVEKIN